MKKRYKSIALFLSIVLGILGVDRFYMGYTKMGILKRLTLGCFGVLYVIDIINIATGKLLPADGRPFDRGVKLHFTQSMKDRIRKKKAEIQLRKGQITEEEFEAIQNDIVKS